MPCIIYNEAVHTVKPSGENHSISINQAPVIATLTFHLLDYSGIWNIMQKYVVSGNDFVETKTE